MKFDFGKDAEFHLVAAGYFSNALYVYNTAPNAHMPMQSPVSRRTPCGEARSR